MTPQEEGMTTHSSIPAWRIPWTEEPGGCSHWGLTESDMTECAHTLQLYAGGPALAGLVSWLLPCSREPLPN